MDVTQANLPGSSGVYQKVMHLSFLVRWWTSRRWDYPGPPNALTSSITSCRCTRTKRIRLRVAPRVRDMAPSIVDIHPSANWFEREVLICSHHFCGHPICVAC